MTITTLIDSNIWIDLMRADEFQEMSADAVADAASDGDIVMSAIVWAELAKTSVVESDLERRLSTLSYRREAFPFAAAYAAGQAHRRYRARGGMRERTLPDFLIGAHALAGRHRLLTRDPARYRTYFDELDILTPEGAA